MSEMTEKLWPVFLAEVSEQIEALELALVGKPADLDVNTVFRYMHTLKGGCAMMGFVSMEVLAHAAEDLLSGARRAEIVLDDSHIDVLLAAVDALKQQLEEARQSRENPAARDELVGRLRGLAQAAPNTLKPAPRRKKSAAQPVAPAAASGNLAEELRRVLPLLARACADVGLPTLPDSTGLQEVMAQQHWQALRHGLLALEVATSRQQRLVLLADLAERLACLEVMQAEDYGSAALAAELRVLLSRDFTLAAAALFETLGLLQSVADTSKCDERNACLLAIQAGISQLLVQAALLGLSQTCLLLRVLAQLLRDVQRDLLALSPELVQAMNLALCLPQELLDSLQEDSTYAAMAQQVLQSLQELAHAGGEESDLRRALKERLALEPDVLEALGRPGLLLLESALQAGHAVMELEADLEQAPDRGEVFVAWVRQAGQLIHSFTLFTSGTASTRLCFLAAFPLAEEVVRQHLGQFDPGRRWLRLRKDDVPVSMVETQAAESPLVTAPAASTLRIDSAVLDQFVSRVGEMVTLRNMLTHTLHDESLLTRLRRLRRVTAERGALLSSDDAVDLHGLLADMETRFEALDQTDARLQGALGRLQEDVLGLRVVPISVVFNRLPRVVRDLSQAQHKLVDLDMEGEDVRIDKGMVDILIEPLMHMVRNSVDHGIELPSEREHAGKPARARLLLHARQQGSSLIIEIRDDGRGLQRERIRQKAQAAGLLTDATGLSDRELCNLIFLPGFSTADHVSEVSGRGVGMDVVRTRVAQVGGQIDVSSEPGIGTCFTLRLPVSAAIQSVVMVAAGGSQYGLPERNVHEVISVPRAAIQRLQGQTVCLLRGVTLPVYHLGVLLGGEEPARLVQDNLLEVVVLSDGVHRIGAIVDSVLGRPEVFLRDMHPDIARLPGIGGVSVLGNGGVLIVLDCDRLFDLALRNAQSLRSLLGVA